MRWPTAHLLLQGTCTCELCSCDSPTTHTFCITPALCPQPLCCSYILMRELQLGITFCIAQAGLVGTPPLLPLSGMGSLRAAWVVRWKASTGSPQARGTRN